MIFIFSTWFIVLVVYLLQYICLHTGNGVDTDQVIGVSSKENGSIRRPGKTGASRDLSVLILFWTEGVNNNLGFQIPNLDAIVSGSTEPVTVRGKAEGVDDFTSIQTVKTLAFVQVPKHGSSVLTTGGTERTIRGDTDSVEVSSVSDKVVAELAVGQGPNLDQTVPSARDNEWDRLGRRETNTRDPFGVTRFALGDGVLAFTQGVPELDSLVTGSGDNLTVVDGEGDTQDILFVSDETTGGLSGVDLPETEGSVPRSGKSELSITGDDNITDEVGMSTKGTTGVTVRIVGVTRVGQLPDKDGLVSGGRQDEVRVLRGGGDGGNPVRVSLKSSAKSQSFRHGEMKSYV